MIKRIVLVLLLVSICKFSYAEHLNYNTDVFDLGRNDKGFQQRKYLCHTAHINYKNNIDKFEKINTTLLFDINRKWKQSKASYHCIIPEYVDDWFEFYNAYEGANHTIKAKPICNHIKGEYFAGEDGQGVIYKDAFSKDIDLKVYAYWGGLKKVICINKKPLDISKDLTFDFELELPQGKDKVKDKDGNIWDKQTTLNFQDKTLKIGEDGKESYFRNAWVWDSGELQQPVNIELFKQGNKIYLRKTILKDILEKVVYPLYTDHPTNYNPTAGDGHIRALTMDTWDTAHDDTGVSATASPTTATMQTGSLNSGGAGGWGIQRSFVPIDTSGIDDGATITNAILYLYSTAKSNTDNDTDDWINVVQTTQADTTGATLVADDFDQCGSVNNPTEGATRIDIGNITTSAYNAWTLDAIGIGWISKTGISFLGTREGHDAIDSPITTDTTDRITVSTSEDTSGTKDPYLDVTVSAGGAASILNPIRIKWN